MNFEDAFNNYKNGTATEEEKAYVKEQICLANALIDGDEKRGANFVEADAETVKKAKKKFKWQYVVVPLCAFVGTLIAIAAILGGVFGSAASYAKKQIMFDRAACSEIAKAEAFRYQQNGKLATTAQSADDFVVKDTDAEFNYNFHDITTSYYTCYVKLYFEDEKAVYIEVDTRTGDVKRVVVKKND